MSCGDREGPFLPEQVGSTPQVLSLLLPSNEHMVSGHN